MLELRRTFAACAGRSDRSVWSDDHVRRDLPLDRFRDDCGFVWQRRVFNLPVTYLLTWLYLESQVHGELLRHLGEDDLFGCQVTTLGEHRMSRDLLDSLCEIAFLERMSGGLDGKRILDIGAGYGRLAHRLVCARPSIGRIPCADEIPESSFLCEFYLRFRGVDHRATTVPLPLIDDELHAAGVISDRSGWISTDIKQCGDIEGAPYR